jgi:hypothetical protein
MPIGVNNITAKPSPDGATTIQFGCCDGKVDWKGSAA